MAASRRPFAVATVYLGTFMASLAISIVSVALPAIQADLHGGLAGLQWIVGTYALCLSAFMLSTGPLADRYGRKRSWLGGVAGRLAHGAPVFLAMLIVSPLFGRLAARYGMRAVMSVGYLLPGLAMLSMALFTPATPYGAVAACFALLGVALGLAVPATGAAMMASAPRERSGAASATMNALRQGGMVIGIALLGSITNAAAVSARAQTFTKAGAMRPPHWRQWPCSEGRCPSRWLWRRSCYSWRGDAAPDLTGSACFPAACETTNGSNSQAL